MSARAPRCWSLLLLALWLAGCARPHSEGERYEVVVLADPERQAALAPILDSLFAERWLTLPSEPRLVWRWGDPARLDESLTCRNLLIAVDGPPAGPVGRFLETLLGAGVRDRVAKEEAFLFRKPEAFAVDQLLLILAAPSPASFRRQSLARRDEMAAQVLAHEQATERASQRITPLQQALEDSLALACGFRLRIPGEWFVVQGMETPPFLRLRCLNPDRWITVMWREGPDSLRNMADGLLAVRGELGRLFWDKDAPLPAPLRFSTVRLNGLEATRLEGLWRADSGAAPSPFLLYAVHVPGAGGKPQGRTFYIDAAVLIPGGARSPYLHQLDQLVATFVGTDAEGRAIGPVQQSETDE